MLLKNSVSEINLLISYYFFFKLLIIFLLTPPYSSFFSVFLNLIPPRYSWKFFGFIIIFLGTICLSLSNQMLPDLIGESRIGAFKEKGTGFRYSIEFEIVTSDGDKKFLWGFSELLSDQDY